MSLIRGLAAFALPALLMGIAGGLGAYAGTLPAAVTSAMPYLPMVALALGVLLAIAFQRGRVLFALLTLGIAWLACRGYLHRGITGHAARAVFVSLCLLLPLNFAAMAFIRERGIFNQHGVLRAAVLAVECAMVAWLFTPGGRETVYALYEPLIPGFAASLRMPQIAMLVTAACVIAGIIAWWRTRAAIDLAFPGAIVAWAFAAQHAPTSVWHLAFIGAGATILAASVLQDVYHMAFRDELTGVPARRALNEHLARLGRRYVIAVLDIDHFKKFNDTHGHDVGDQVLKMVASRIERVRGGGHAYRFGGEEFVVVFPGATVAQVLPHLEALRLDVAQHGLTLRSAERPVKAPARTAAHARKPRRSRNTRSSQSTGKRLSVTISIGVAERGDKLSTPASVLTAADKALYRAKHAGRNRVSR